MKEESRRLIKVKEYGLNYEWVKVCPYDYREVTAGSKFKLATDENGFIRTGNHYSQGESIVVLGDSFVEALFVAENQRFCSVAERILREKYEKNYLIYNCGMSGTHMLSCIFTLLAKIIPLKPKGVILFLPAIDFAVVRLARGYWNLDKNLSIFYGLTDRVKEMLPPDIGNLEQSHYLTMLDIFTNILEKFNIKYCICSRPYYKKGDMRRKLNEYALNHCKEKKYPFVDFDSLLVDEAPLLFYDNLHLHQRGCIVMGELLAEKIYSDMKF